ncbi:MAG: aspartate/glutamate racemase family protein [Pseudomonadota bacterium]
MHIGLIGGIGPAATDFYYRNLIRIASETGRKLELTIAHADSPPLLKNLSANDEDAQCAIFLGLTDRLQKAGAENVVVTSIAGHFCIDRFAERSPLPVIDLTKEVSAWLNDKGMKRVGIMGTETVMRSGMYGKLTSVEVIAPDEGTINNVHEAYVTLARTGEPTDALRAIFVAAADAMMARGAEAILLGGTDLNAAFDAETAPFPIVDCAGIHVDAIARQI